ncbi:MAG: ribbon-helix-helix domain-containing protein [Thiogranum sp.]|nr:ribbon-helix-helix domain-containing protein [Thiogranum sp.]
MNAASPGQKQLAVRVDDETLQAIDQKRMALAEKGSGGIPSRSDVVRMALDQYLGIKGTKKRA